MSHFASPLIYIDSEAQTVFVKACADPGVVAEAIAAQWLLNLGWTILHHRWRCRWGEIDLIAHSSQPTPPPVRPQIMTFNTSSSDGSGSLVFVEVKARSRGNWDANGLLSITPAKRAKLWKAAELFLSEAPHLAQDPCRFDVILIRQGRSPQSSPSRASSSATSPDKAHITDGMISVSTIIQPRRWIVVGQSRCCLEQHLQHVFEQEG